ncbi:Mitochondrial transcription termination factor family protein isoform 1 [Hibiscus syriacus]|uniref:Mitochondrial transcription termination factor family protein isoform 1 n=1 Tax=Hibiscus syriacus TaxID=106335 RepID=A0A6A2ZE10_HIBSY|nr:Mitochondrial transcription termination factor family protein isoform 1 [Hibiscus syriacus]
MGSLNIRNDNGFSHDYCYCNFRVKPGLRRQQNVPDFPVKTCHYFNKGCCKHGSNCRPHGQHAVILAEDALKHMENRNDQNSPGPVVNGSRQIYLTFPAESTFSEDDVSTNFSSYGQVEDVRIPCQQKRCSAKDIIYRTALLHPGSHLGRVKHVMVVVRMEEPANLYINKPVFWVYENRDGRRT